MYVLVGAEYITWGSRQAEIGLKVAGKGSHPVKS